MGCETVVDLYKMDAHSEDQAWYVEQTANGQYEIQGFGKSRVCSKKALSTDGGSLVDLWEPGGVNQKWDIPFEPAPGTFIAGVPGKRNRILACPGCSKFTYKVTVGVTSSKGTTKTTSNEAWVSVALQTKAKVGNDFASGEVTTSYEAGYRHTDSSAVSSSFAIAKATEKTLECEKKFLWQWVQTVEAYSVGGVSFTVANSPVFLCTNSAGTPRDYLVRR